jgi:NitT/TauT family transport system ATP-binding protein
MKPASLGDVPVLVQPPQRAREAGAAERFLSIEGIGKTFAGQGGRETVALQSASLDVSELEVVAIVGPSGCGKSTLLQIIAGLIPPDRGVVTLRGSPVNAPPAGVVYLFQQYTRSLLPWRTVAGNVMLALEDRPGLSSARRKERVHEHLVAMQLDAFADHYPWQLSGGMQQRLTLARALAADANVLLLDEPFSSVDALTRIEMQDLLLGVCASRTLTILLVTHDVDEAVYVADRVAVMGKRPAMIESVVDVGLPRPRHRIETRESARFLELRRALLDRLLGYANDPS